MNIFNFFLAAEAQGAGQGMDLTMVFLLLGLFLIMIVMNVIPQRKRKKQMLEMMNNLVPGAEIKTIGGMVGKIVQVDDENGLFVINVGTDELPTLIKIDRSAVYTVAQPEAPAPEVFENNEESTEAGESVAEGDSAESEDKE